jgi:hypothetical protein
VPGHFEASPEPEFDFDPLRTEVEIQASGEETLRWLAELASRETPPAVDIELIRSIHRRWFESTFPVDAGRERAEMVLNRKGTAVPVEAILPGMEHACENWKWRRENVAPDDPVERFRFIVSEANTLAVAVYDVHPFIDGNTRTTWHLRNYVFMLDGVLPLVDLQDQDDYEDVWWAASPLDHDALDIAVIAELHASREASEGP